MSNLLKVACNKFAAAELKIDGMNFDAGYDKEYIINQEVIIVECYLDSFVIFRKLCGDIIYRYTINVTDEPFIIRYLDNINIISFKKEIKSIHQIMKLRYELRKKVTVLGL